jgi:hypothetical protein
MILRLFYMIGSIEFGFANVLLYAKREIKQG